MRDVFRVLWEAAKNLWDELFLLMLMNIVTLLPVIAALAGLWYAASRVARGGALGWIDYLVTVLLLIPLVAFPPALAGLWNAANVAAKGRVASWADYVEGLRRYFWKAWGLALLNVLVALIVSTNVRFYTPGVTPFEISPTLSTWIGGAFVALACLWLIFQMYPMAMLLEQEDQRLRVALRNSAVLFIANLGFTIVLALVLLLVAVISTLLPVLWIVAPAVFAVVCNKAVLHLLKPFRERAQAEGEKEEEDG